MTGNPSTSFALAAVLRPFQAFFRLEAASGILLLLSTVVALIWANSAYAGSYFGLWQTRMTVGVGAFVLSKPLLLWINDGLMAIFFFVVGLEIKREVLVGELSSPREAALPLAAALGGMMLPAAIYLSVTLVWGAPEARRGWAVPVATDIAFALGILALLGRHVPPSLKVFLTALAIADDLAAVLVIAFFYTAELAMGSLAVAGVCLLALMAVNRLGVRRTVVYVLLGLATWVAVLKSGVHATIAGVLVAMTIPARGKIDVPAFVRRGRRLIDAFDEDGEPDQIEPNARQRHRIFQLEHLCEQATKPLERMEHALHPWVAFGIIPLFALSNAGVSLDGELGSALTDPITLGVFLGLFLGKQSGVLLFSWLVLRLGLARRPAGASWRQLYGVACLCGIGFTMSLFIAGLAFTPPHALVSAKLGILGGSLASALLGAGVLLRLRSPAETTNAAET